MDPILDQDVESSCDLGVQLDRHFMHAEGLDGVGKLDLFLVQIQTVLVFGCLGDLLGADGTEDLAALTGLHGHGDLDLLQIGSHLLCIRKLFGCQLFFVLLLELQVIQIFLGRFQTQFFGNDHISGIAVAHIDDLALFAQGFYIFQ